MNVEPIWIIGEGLAFAGAGLLAYIGLTNRVTSIESRIPKDLAERVTRLEAQVHDDLFERVVSLEAVFNILGEKAAKLLHSDDDPYQIDSLLDKYLDRHYELSFAEWEALLAKCSVIEENKVLSKDERLLAGWISAVCHHKLRRPPPEKRKYETDHITQSDGG